MKKRSGTGRILLFTGDGKGKTTAALGILFRAFGYGMSAKVISFIKSGDRICGEELAAKKMNGIEFDSAGAGFTWLSKDLEKDKRLAREGWEKAKLALSDKKVNIVLLDEITYPINYGWLTKEEVVEAAKERIPNQHLIITGRDACKELIELADTVTEMKEIKHGFKHGIPATRGIEM